MWGGLEMWPNYTTIYVWHEIFHSILPGQGLKTTDLDHALIQLITDNELNARLNGFSYPPFDDIVIPLSQSKQKYCHSGRIS